MTKKPNINTSVGVHLIYCMAFVIIHVSHLTMLSEISCYMNNHDKLNPHETKMQQPRQSVAHNKFTYTKAINYVTLFQINREIVNNNIVLKCLFDHVECHNCNGNDIRIWFTLINAYGIVNVSLRKYECSIMHNTGVSEIYHDEYIHVSKEIYMKKRMFSPSQNTHKKHSKSKFSKTYGCLRTQKTLMQLIFQINKKINIFSFIPEKSSEISCLDMCQCLHALEKIEQNCSFNINVVEIGISRTNFAWKKYNNKMKERSTRHKYKLKVEYNKHRNKTAGFGMFDTANAENMPLTMLVHISMYIVIMINDCNTITQWHPI